jgi:hypothetical protein
MKILLSLILLGAMQAAAPSPVQVISREMMSLVDEPRQVVARSASEWATVWRQHAGEKPLPSVDFKTRMVVAIFLGSRGSAGYSAEVTRTRAVDGALIVEWQERRPQRGEVSAQVMTSPVVMVSLAKFDGEIRFEKVEP